MGWNTGWTIMEKTVVGSYNLGKLDKALLGVLMEPYRGSDIDSGGSQNLRAQDGKDVQDIVIEVWGRTAEVPTMPPAIRKNQKLSDQEEDAWEEYWEAKHTVFYDITDKEYGWE